MIHNTVKGAYGVGGFAAITVRFPIGSICTCALGGITLTATTTSLYTFFVPMSGNWVITATGGALSASEVVPVNNMGDNKYIELAFNFSPEINRNFLSPYFTSGGDATIENGYFRTIIFGYDLSTYHCNTVYTKNKVRMTGYSKIRVHVSNFMSTMSYQYKAAICAVISPVFQVTGAERYTAINNTGWFELDISTLDGEYFLQIGCFCTGNEGNTITNFTVDEIQFIANEEEA